MKSKLLVGIAAVIVMALAVAAFAYNRSNADTSGVKDCCAKKDACPMKMKGDKADAAPSDMERAHSAKGVASCCGDSCPMRMKSDKSDAGMARADAGTEKASCCCSGDSCPMMNKDKAAGADAKHADDMKGQACCGCCSKAKTETAAL